MQADPHSVAQSGFSIFSNLMEAFREFFSHIFLLAVAKSLDKALKTEDLS